MRSHFRPIKNGIEWFPVAHNKQFYQITGQGYGHRFFIDWCLKKEGEEVRFHTSLIMPDGTYIDLYDYEDLESARICLEVYHQAYPKYAKTTGIQIDENYLY